MSNDSQSQKVKKILHYHSQEGFKRTQQQPTKKSSAPAPSSCKLLDAAFGWKGLEDGAETFCRKYKSVRKNEDYQIFLLLAVLVFYTSRAVQNSLLHR
jgi:hypothetical protein